MYTRRDKPKSRSNTLCDALLPLATKGVSADEAMALIIAANAALRPGLGMGWAAIETILEDVCKPEKPSHEMPVVTKLS